jgi:hypothetical protein
MIILLHIIVALLSIGMATFVAVRPTTRRLLANYALAVSTIGTGVFLVVNDNSQLVAACKAGLLYVIVAAVLTVIAHRQLHKRPTLET